MESGRLRVSLSVSAYFAHAAATDDDEDDDESLVKLVT